MLDWILIEFALLAFNFLELQAFYKKTRTEFAGSLRLLDLQKFKREKKVLLEKFLGVLFWNCYLLLRLNVETVYNL